MTCPLCKTGSMKPGVTTVVLTKGDLTVVFKNVPALVCDDCGDYILEESIATIIHERAEQSFASGQEIAISQFNVA